MANHRMFSNRVANSAKFLQMPAESQLLYFHMVLRADDDGIVESYPLIKLLGVPSDNFKVLLAKDFIRQINEDQVIIITDWLEHNLIRADRKVNSMYIAEARKALPDRAFVEPKPRSDVKDNTNRVGNDSPRTVHGRLKLSKDKLSKDNKTIAAIAAPVELKPFLLQEEIEKLYENPRRDLNIIGWYFEKRKPDIRDKAQLLSSIKRHLRSAKQLEPFADDQIGKAHRYVAAEYPEWTLETLVKKLSK